MKYRITILSAALALLATCASASFISIESIPSVFVKDGEVIAALDIQNLGDEPAYDVSVQASCSDSKARSEALPELLPDGISRLVADLGPIPKPDGIYTVIYTVSYTDSGGKTYSALNTISLVTDLDSPPRQAVDVEIESTMLKKKADVSVAVSASEILPEVRVSLFLPNEIRVTPEIRTVSVETDTTASASFELRNESANPGSTYLALLVTDYKKDGTHISKATPFNVKISSEISVSHSPYILIIIGLLAAAGLAFQHSGLRSKLRISDKAYGRIETGILLVCIMALEAFLLHNLQPKYLFMDTTTVGGDTPAHNYIASHLSESLFGHGKIISWAGGWWCGFPMFQFYFFLPYLLIALLNLILPFNLAFKLICVSGILTLAPAVWLAGRMMKLPRPIPMIMALFTIPLLFDHSHVMWGVNIYSTLAGMISNSLSFPLMLLFIASAWRDSKDSTFRLLTVFLLTAVLASHFFTSIIGMITVAVIPFLQNRKQIIKSSLVLGAEIALALALMAWWMVPLIAKIEYTAEFGTNWPDINLLSQLPPIALWLSPLLIPSIIIAIAGKTKVVWAILWMLAASVLLFFFGFGVSNVFVNVRLWPFIVCSLLLLEAIGLGYLLSLLPSKRALIPALTLAALVFAVDSPNHVPQWAKWNFEGLEAKQHYPVFEKLVLPLEGTPGRLANDLCDENNMLGSSRIFELTPHLTGKPVLEGGIVNSAAGSMFSYYIQSETSENCAGFPTNLKPTTFNITNATRHLELFNVKHFIARWEVSRQALQEHKDWRFIGREQEWELYELTSHDGSYVFVPELMPVAVKLDPHDLDWKTASLKWIYNPASLDQHFVILRDGESSPYGMKSISADSYLSLMESGATASTAGLTSAALKTATVEVSEHSDYAIEFETDSPGIPHIIKTTWYPNWKSESGERIYMVTPCFMLIIPNSNHVRIVYGSTLADITGKSITTAGFIFVLALGAAKLINSRKEHHPDKRNA